ncbi:MAG: PIG-L family deacetylase [Candidatus Promineifilaceae bacterium]
MNVLVVFAHPDDESGFGGTLAMLADSGAKITYVLTTRGEEGDIYETSIATKATLGAVRSAEMRKSCNILGVQDIRYLGFRDSGIEGWPQNKDPRSYYQANDESVIAMLVQIMREIRPNLVITFEPSGWYGHPDHIIACRHTTAAFDAASDPAAYPETGAPFAPEKLYYATFLGSNFAKFGDAQREFGIPEDQIRTMKLDPALETQVTHRIDVTPWLSRKREAMSQHLTQRALFKRMLSMPDALITPAYGNENYIQARPVVEVPDVMWGVLF